VHCLRSLSDERQGCKLNRIVVDNGSNDGTVRMVRKRFPDVHIIELERNTGYAHANNVGIRSTNAAYVLVVNPDTYTSRGCLRALVQSLDADERVGSVGPKLLRTEETERIPHGEQVIDSTGIRMRRRRSAEDRGAGETDSGQYDAERSVFGISGAFVLYRRSALERGIIGDGFFFDELHESYKEDVDLAWRLRSSGWSSRYVPEAVAWHRRTVRSHTMRRVTSERGKRTKNVRYLSYRNHLLTIAKNESMRHILWYLPEIMWYEVRKSLFLLFREPMVLLAFMEFIVLTPTILRRRRDISISRRVPAKELNVWFTR